MTVIYLGGDRFTLELPLKSLLCHWEAFSTGDYHPRPQTHYSAAVNIDLSVPSCVHITFRSLRIMRERDASEILKMFRCCENYVL